jgi:hypothetical protein
MGISPTFSKSMVKRIGVFQKFVKTKQNKVKPCKILQDRSKTNIFVSNCVEEEKQKKMKLRLFWEKAKKNEYNRSSTIKYLPLLGRTAVVTIFFLWNFLLANVQCPIIGWPIFVVFYLFYYILFGAEPDRIGLLGKSPAAEHSLPSKSQ